MDYSGSLLLKSAGGHRRATIDLSYAPSLAAIETLCATLSPLTRAEIARASWIQSNTLTGFPATSGEIYDLDYSAHFKFRRTAPDNDVYFRNFRLPAPIMDMFELIEGKGYRIKSSYGNTTAAALSIVWADPVTFDSGWLVH